MKTTKKIALLGIGIALYVVLSSVFNLPILAGTHLKTDLGYIAFGVFLYCVGWEATIVGVAGCFIESMLFSGWIPIGWMVGQLLIGIICGIAYKKIKNIPINIIITIIAVFIGIGLCKTAIECYLYTIPFGVKFAKNAVAFIADAIPMVIGLLLGYKLKPVLMKN